MAKQIGFGVKLAVNDGPNGAYRDFDGTTLVVVPARELGEQESTSHDADGSKDFEALLSDEGTLKLEVNYNHAQLARLHTLYNGRVKRQWQVRAPQGVAAGRLTGQVIVFTGFLKKIDEMAFEREGMLMNKIEVRVTKRPVLTPGTDPA
jgi:hypothetical protein